jgi:hypothetical protein
VHAEHIGHSEIIANHDLFREFAVQVIKLIKTRRKRRHYVAAGSGLLLAVDVITQSLIQHSLKLSALPLSNLT